MFKKRNPKSNVRIKEASVVDSDDEAHSQQLQEIKAQQNMRSRKSGSSADRLYKSGHNEKDEAKNPAEKKTIESVMGNQYTAHIDYGIQNVVPHKKLMDEYIEEKLGFSKKIIQEVKPLTAEEILYKIPEDLKVIAKSEKHLVQKVDGSENNGGMSWSTGIAEVALPIDFKIRNIEETERAANEYSQARFESKTSSIEIKNSYYSSSAIIASSTTACSKNSRNNMPFQRFMVPEHATRVKDLPSLMGIDKSGAIEQFLDSSIVTPSSANTTAQEGASSNSHVGGGVGLKRSQQSSDDYVLEKYKKRQMNYRR